MSIPATTAEAATFRLVVLVLVTFALIACVPLWAPVVMSAWVATMSRPLLLRLGKAFHGRERAAAALTLLLVVVMLIPLVVAVVSLASGAADLIATMSQSKGGVQGALVAAVSGDSSTGVSPAELMAAPRKIIPLIQAHGAEALRVAGGIAGAAAKVGLGLFLFFLGMYTFLVDGPAFYVWVERHALIPAHHTQRLRDAFHETGRGLFVGVGLTGLSQGAIATVAYLALGVPRALVLGMLTCIGSLIPSVGTGLVWVPVAIGLALSGRTTPAIILAAVGVLVISTIDNVLRPVFARYGKLQLPTYALLLSIFGGLTVFGTWGLVLGPLALRMAREGLVLLRMDKLAARRKESAVVGVLRDDDSVVDRARAFPDGSDDE